MLMLGCPRNEWFYLVGYLYALNFFLQTNQEYFVSSAGNFLSTLLADVSFYNM